MQKLQLSGESSPSNVYFRVAMLGFVAGLRTMTPLSWLSWNGANPVTESSSLLDILHSPTIKTVTRLLAIGELFADKLPIMPSRLKPGPLTARIVMGGLTGMTLCRRYDQPPLAGAMLGGTSALVSAYVGYFLRKGLSKGGKVPAFVWGVAEDMLVLGLGQLAK